MIEEPLPDLVCLHSPLLPFPSTSLRLPATSIPSLLAGLWVPSVAGRLTVQKAQPHRAPRIVPVEVDQHDALPGAQLRLATDDRHRHRRRDDAPATHGRRRGPANRARAGSGRRAATAVPACRPGRRRSRRPVSMIATPAVACGTNTLHRPSPREAEPRTASVRSTMRRRAVSTSSRSVCTRSSLRRGAGLPKTSQSFVSAATPAKVVAGGNRQEEGIWWDRWRHRGAAPTQEGSIVYARSTTIQAQPLSIDIGIAHVRDVVMPALQEMNGYVGLSLLVDRQSGRCIATSAWETMEAMRASAERVAPVRDRAALMFDGSARGRRMGHRVAAPRPPLARRGVRAGHLAQGGAGSAQPVPGLLPDHGASGTGEPRRVLQRQPDGRPPGMPAGGVLLDVRQHGRDGPKPRPGDRAAQQRASGTWAPR